MRDPASGEVSKAVASSRGGRDHDGFDLVSVLRQIDGIGPTPFAVGAAVLFFALGTLAYLPSWPGDPSRIVSCACEDPVQQSWFLGWLPWAVLHGHNPFFTNWFDFPSGVNLASNTEMPLLGLITAPLTLTAGPVASYGLLLWLAYPLSAMSAFFVLRHWTRSNLGALLGGLLYGFSPYMVNQGQLHLNLVFVPLPPLILMALIEITITQRSSPFRWGVLLGVLVTAQYLISPELLTTVLLMLAIAAVVVVAARFRSISRGVSITCCARSFLGSVSRPRFSPTPSTFSSPGANTSTDRHFRPTTPTERICWEWSSRPSASCSRPITLH